MRNTKTITLPAAIALISVLFYFLVKPIMDRSVEQFSERQTDISGFETSTMVKPVEQFTLNEFDNIAAPHCIPETQPRDSGFKRGVNSELALQAPRVSKVSAKIQSRPPVALSREPSDGRHSLLPDEINERMLNARRFELNFSAIEQVMGGTQGRLIAPLPGGGELELRIDLIKKRSNASHAFVGKIDGLDQSSEAILVYHDGVIRGSIVDYTKGRFFELRSLGAEHLVVEEIDKRITRATCGTCELHASGHDHTESLHEVSSKKTVASQHIDTDAAQRFEAMEALSNPHHFGHLAADKQFSADAAPMHDIDIVVGYGRVARQEVGGVAEMEALIIKGVEYMNTAFANSEINNARLVLIGTIEDPHYAFPGNRRYDMYEEYYNLGHPSDGKLDAVYAYSILLGADKLSFITSYEDEPPGQSHPFNVAGVGGGYTSVLGHNFINLYDLTFCHEVGHCLGAWHAWGDGGSGDSNVGTSTFPNYNNGWRLRPAFGTRVVYRTIMAYGNYSSLLHFSNPDILFNGARTGAYEGYDASNDDTVHDRLVSGGHAGNQGQGFDGSNPYLGARNAHSIRENAESHSQSATRTLSLEIIEPLSEYLGILDTGHGLKLIADSVSFEVADADVIWEHISGPGTAQFADDEAESTSVFFTHEGTHELRITATEGAVQLTRDLVVDVGAYVPPALPVPEIGWWKLDEGSGNIAADSTTPANNGTLGGFSGDPWVPGQFESALSFSDSSDFVTIPDSEELDGMTQVTFACWVNPAASDDNWRGIIGKNVNHNVAESYAIYVGPSNRIWAKIDSGLPASNGSLPANEWTHVVVTFDGSKDAFSRMQIYLNGQLDSEHYVSLNQVPITSSPLYLGSLQGTGVNGHNGLLDDVRIYNRALSDAEIALFVESPPNYGPEIQLSVSNTARIGTPKSVSATIQDDGLPVGGSLLQRWSGANVSFEDTAALSTNATFSATGDQVIRLSASDGDVTTFKTMSISVAEILVSFNDWATDIDWQGRDSSADSVDNAYRIPNIILFAMDLDPVALNPDATLPRVASPTDSNTFSFTYRRSKLVDSIVFYPQYSNDLITWNAIDADAPDVTISVIDPDVDGDGSAELILVEVANVDKLFFNLFSQNAQ
ncbi:LamG-like jellyroll fold domain-containing protein [Rubellicoccus peritrichatus]|uniref:LamG-like jellyroll fold domain-containing protein n=1 Tax=Rubellicoccus peritrichatus TaxID=3080537 RepID=A0AAQ3QPT3_9BACT|nr:LamG-like jellyroll fold domain-containing protein [Puniceicoccus sp. CR14]WOO39428.1 LamG-like jellyroll fold domain-containing protein [Puniceicoccus sp. CR14]